MKDSAAEEEGVGIVGIGGAEGLGVYLFELREGGALAQVAEETRVMMGGVGEGGSMGR